MNKPATWSAILFALVFPTFVTLLYFVILANHPPAAQLAASGIGKLLQFAFPVVWVFWIAREKIAWTGPKKNDLLLGLGSGLLIGGAMLALYHLWLASSLLFAGAIEPIREKIVGFGINTWWKYAALGIFYALVHSLLEEYYWRWFVFGELRRLAPLWAAIMVSSLGFTAHHVLLLGVYFGYNSPLTWLFAAAIAIGGGLWAWMYNRTNSLWGVWLSHLLVDAGIFIVGWHVKNAW